MKLHNTASKSLETLKPIDQPTVTMYSCGPTVYNYPHIGNWFGYIHWDVLVRILMHEGYDVQRIINITDVGHLTGDNEGDADTGEDKLEKSARLEKKTAQEVAKFYTDNYLTGFDALGLIHPKKFPLATDYIDQQLELVRILKEKGYTYQISDGIYFDTAKFPHYADFAELKLDEQQAGARVEFNPEKHNPSDFALWKFSPVGEKRDMEWETPTDILEDTSGIALSETALAPTIMGFPGWHIECSAMIMSLLGETIDIHTGGIDHIPVHHTNEIAQAEAATGQPLAHIWLHNNHMKSDGTKISKSLGNGYTLEDLADRGYTPLDFRMLVLQSHYQSESNFSFENLEAAKNRLLSWRNFAALRHQTHDTLANDDDKDSDGSSISLLAASQALSEALSGNINTPEALALIDAAFARLARAKLSEIHQHALVAFIETIDELLGLKLLDTTPDVSDDIKQLILERKHARTNEDWKKSDDLRKEIEREGIALRDTTSDSIWTYTN